MTREVIKYHAYTELGFRPHEHKYVDDLITQIANVRGLAEEENPLNTNNNYKSTDTFIESINSFLQKYALRAGERTDIKPLEMTEKSIASFENIFYHLQMRKEKTPQHNSYNAVLCMGAAENGVRPRINQLAKIISNSDIKVENIMVLGSERKLWPLKKDGDNLSFPEPILYDILSERLSQRDGKPVSAEEIKKYILNLNTKETTVDKLSTEISSDKYFSGIKWPTETDLIHAVIKENPTFNGQNIVVVRTPDFPDGKRADSGRTIEYAHKENPNIFATDAKVLLLSSQPFTRNQQRIAELNLPQNVNIDVVGEGVDEGKRCDARKKDVMIAMDSVARTIYATYAKIKEREHINNLSLHKNLASQRC